MGVDGLLKFLQPIIKKEHLSSFRHKTAAIDIMSWLYRSLYNSADLMREDPQSIAFLFYLHQMIDLLEYYQIKIICLFDGRFLKQKETTINKRRTYRENNKKKGEELIEKGDEESGNKFINRCIYVNQHVLSTTMRALKGRNIRYIISPYQSDCQIAKLYQLAMVDFAVSEDSDLVIYGVPVVLKLSNEGDCDYLNINEVNPEEVDNIFIRDFVKMSKMRRTEVAVLTGTDYLPSIKGIGIKKALKFITQSQNLQDAIAKIDEIQKFKAQMPQNYLNKAQQALLIFFISTTYNPQTQKLQFLSENSPEMVQIAQRVPMENLRVLAGEDYGYTDGVRDGLQQVWSLQDRDLSPIPYDGKSTLNQSALRDKELTLQNLKVVLSYYEGKSPIIHKDQLLQNQLRMMCESRQAITKKEELVTLKLQLEQNFEKEIENKGQQLKRSLSKQKMSQFKSKFPQWMIYCPQDRPQDSIPYE